MKIDFFDTKQYMDELVRRFNEGGTIWLIERTDTNEFYYPSLEPHIHSFKYGAMPRYCKWTKDISLFVVTSGFLTKEDAEKYQWHRDGFERGCSNCGHGGIPTTITEHEFVCCRQPLKKYDQYHDNNNPLASNPKPQRPDSGL